MSDEQIQKITTALYSEGVEKGEKKAAQIIEEAQQKAAQILNDARAEAQKIIHEAQEQGNTFKQHVETETRIAAQEIIHNFHHAVVEMILVRIIDEKLDEDFKDMEKLSQWVAKIIENWRCDAKEQPSLSILIPEKELADFNKWFEKKVAGALRTRVTIESSKSIATGFQIIPKDGSYKIDMSSEAFSELFRHYLKARTRKLLFGESV